ncbi:MAG: glycosyltransferase family 4 protein, partial [Desulfovibrio sp.]|nr:glycosyltransferase family 4 protein [Desulfovibrio sp.]
YGAEAGIRRYTRQIAAEALAFPSFRTDCTPCLPERNWNGTVQKKGEGFFRAHLPPPILNAAQNALSLLKAVRPLRPGPFADCYFEPDVLPTHQVHAKTRVLTVHDLSSFTHPEWQTKEHTVGMERAFEESLGRADRIITVSNAVRNELLSLFSLPEEKVETIPNGVDHAIFSPVPLNDCLDMRSRLHVPEHFILHVGSLSPRKNPETLLTAISLLPKTLRRHYPLVLAGVEETTHPDLLNRLAAMPFVRLLSHVSDPDLSKLYNTADLMVHPSLYEGFGLPVLEAMACGCPVLTSTDPALLETGGGAASHVDARDAEGMALKIRNLLEDERLREEKSVDGLKEASRFSWHASAKRHLDLFWKLCRSS